MNIGVLMNVYNEAEWLDCAIGSIIDWTDTIVIVEGAYGIAIEAGASERSTDGTLDILDIWQKNYPNKITLIKANERDEAPQLQLGVEILKQKKVDWYLLVDGDEIWEKRDLALIRAAIVRGDANSIYQYRAMFYNFINSFDKYYDGKFKRVFKLTPGAKTIGQNGLMWPDVGLYCDTGTNEPHIGELPDMCRCFHYTEIKPKNRWLLKKSYLQVRDNNPRFKHWYATRDGFINDEKDIKTFRKRHPEITQKSKLYKLWDKNPEFLRHELFDD